MVSSNAYESDTASLVFVSHYVLAICLLAEIWGQLSPRTFGVRKVMLDCTLDKLDACLRRMRYGFPGLCKEEDSHILELMALCCVLRFSKNGICSHHVFKKLQGVISRLELLYEGGSCTMSKFTDQLKKICTEGSLSIVSKPFLVHSLLELFNLDMLPFTGQFEHAKAELQAIGNDSENPLPFISGLPVGITFQIRLFNISDSGRLWLQIAIGELIQYVFLDLCQFGSGKMRECTLNTPFYSTPNASSCLLKACIVMECPYEDTFDARKDQGGPKCEILFLCDKKDVYLVEIKNEEQKNCPHKLK